jgi:disulfide bond formation protein DsbB
MIPIEIFNFGISSAVVLTQVFFLVLVACLVVKLVFKYNCKTIDFLSKNWIYFALLIALACIGGSLYYSEIMGYDPCKLCWFQRIFIYPQALILLIALWTKDKLSAKYILGLSAFAAVIAGYHYLGQLGFTDLECGLVGYSSKCSERFVMNFGYITIPLMAATAMVTNFCLALLNLVNKK